MVEEGEVIFNDFVYSDRITVDSDVMKTLGIKGKNMTYAKVAKKMAKESEERPNDPLSEAALKQNLQKLA